MPSTRELRRGIALGVYRDTEKDARDERRVQVAEENAALAREREIRTGANDDTRTGLDKLRFENERIKAKAAEMAEERVLTDSIEATRKLVDIPATTPDFPSKLQKILAEHPRALSDRAFQEQYQWNQGLHKEWLGQKQASDKLAEEQRLKMEAKKELQNRSDANFDKLAKMPGAKLKSASLSSATGEIDPMVSFEEDDTARKSAQDRYDKALALRMNPALAKVLYEAENGKPTPAAIAAKDQAAFLDQELRETKALLSPSVSGKPAVEPAAEAARQEAIIAREKAAAPKIVRMKLDAEGNLVPVK